MLKLPDKIPQTDATSGYDLGEFRYCVAKFIRMLIQARNVLEPGFLPANELTPWKLEQTGAAKLSAEVAMKYACAAYECLWRDFIGPNGSGGIHPDDPLGELKELIVQFAFSYEPKTILAAMQAGKKSHWKEIQWESLADIRSGLDRLPHPKSSPEWIQPQDPCPIQLADKKARRVELCGETKSMLPAQWDVLQVLVKHYPTRLHKDDLIRLSKRTDAIAILGRLRISDDDWKRVISLAGSTGAGYGLNAPPAD